MGLPGRPGLEWDETGFFNYIENLTSLFSFLARRGWNCGLKSQPKHSFKAPGTELQQRFDLSYLLLLE
jgi:hypothetical protein